MAKIDVSKHGIRVILNREFYNNGSKKAPLDVEGTVLFIDTRSGYTKDLLKQGDILEILCTYELELDDTYVLVRWDNDIKHWFSSGMFALRESKLSRCKTIWDSTTKIVESTIPFSELQPGSHRPQSVYSDWTDGNKYTVIPEGKKQAYTYHGTVVQEIPRAPKNPESIDPPGYLDISYQSEQKITLIPPEIKHTNISPTDLERSPREGIKLSTSTWTTSIDNCKPVKKAKLPSWRQYKYKKVDDDF